MVGVSNPQCDRLFSLFTSLPDTMRAVLAAFDRCANFVQSRVRDPQRGGGRRKLARPVSKVLTGVTVFGPTSVQMHRSGVPHRRHQKGRRLPHRGGVFPRAENRYDNNPSASMSRRSRARMRARLGPIDPRGIPRYALISVYNRGGSSVSIPSRVRSAAGS